MENLRKRTTREIADSRQYAVTSFARDMLNVADNLKRAIAAVPSELRDGGNKAVTAFLDGVEVTERGLEQTLGKFGVKSIEAKGEKFNPEFHQAIYELETAEVPPEPSPRWYRPATSSVTACCARRWWRWRKPRRSPPPIATRHWQTGGADKT